VSKNFVKSVFLRLDKANGLFGIKGENINNKKISSTKKKKTTKIIKKDANLKSFLLHEDSKDPAEVAALNGVNFWLVQELPKIGQQPFIANQGFTNDHNFTAKDFSGQAWIPDDQATSRQI